MSPAFRTTFTFLVKILPINRIDVLLLFKIKRTNSCIGLGSKTTYLNGPEIDSRLLRPKSDVGTGEMVTIECLLPPDAGIVFCESVARNSTSLLLSALPSEPASDNLLTWLAVIPSVICNDGKECLRRCCKSGNGDNRYGFTGDSASDDSPLLDFLLCLESSSSPTFVSSTTINGS